MSGHIVKRYTSPGDPVAFSSAQAGHEDLRRQGLTHTSKENVEEQLSKLKSHTLHKEKKKVKKFNPIYVYDKRRLMQADLFHVDQLSRRNAGYNYILLVQDTFTRFVWARPLKKKTAEEVLDQFKSIFEETGNFDKLLTDQGLEFRSKIFQDFCTEKNIKFFHNYTSGHASHIERAGRSLQRLMYKFMTETGSKRYIDHLQLLVRTMNNRPTRGLGGRMTPAEAELEENVLHVRNQHEKRYSSVPKKPHTLPIGQIVRLRRPKNVFDRSYKEQNTSELYEVIRVDLTKRIPLYTLRDYIANENGEKRILDGKVYHTEVVPVTVI